MEAVLTRLKDFSCKTPTFSGREAAEQSGSRTGGCRLDLESSLAWLRRELELRSQDQVLIRQLMELHSGIQELKMELSEDEEGSCWDSDSDHSSICSGSEQVRFTCRLQANRR
uniref:Si:ch211-153f2.7 n=1 Tax=Stegastes partitus TaxID=144197 RepID=A0A3B5AXT9_9TELE